MTIKDDLASGFANLISKAGRPITIRYYSQTTGSVWDDDSTLNLSGTLVTSGIILPLSRGTGGADNILVEQGKLRDDDSRLYLNGSVDLTKTNLQIKVQLGSNVGDAFTTIPLNVAPEVEATRIYKKQYMRYLPTGSLIGEA